jgi:hypothetical protein
MRIARVPGAGWAPSEPGAFVCVSYNAALHSEAASSGRRVIEKKHYDRCQSMTYLQGERSGSRVEEEKEIQR